MPPHPIGVFEVVPDGAAEQVGLLQDVADFAAKLGWFVLVEGAAFVGDRSGGGAAQQV